MCGAAENIVEILESAPQGRRQLQLSFPKIGCLQFIAQLSPPHSHRFIFFKNDLHTLEDISILYRAILLKIAGDVPYIL